MENTEKVAEWVPKGQAVTVAGIVIPDGMVYVGTRLDRIGGYGTDNCLIKPRLAVRPSPPGTTIARLPYYASYEGLDPQQRHAYLHWLAGGRRDPAAEIGLVFLFFYGLERRLIAEQGKTGAETADLMAEVERLRELYGANASFVRYSGELLAMARLLHIGVPDEPPDLREPRWEMPVDLRVGLGHRLAQGHPLSAEWMLAWQMCDPELPWRTPGKRCFAEFRELFLRRFAAVFPGGLSVAAPKRQLALIYQAASGSFRATIGGNDGLSDPAALKAPLNKVRPIALACLDDLDPLSRFLGRNSDRRDSLEAFALLPADLRDRPPPSVQAHLDWLDGLIVEEPAALVPVMEVGRRLLGGLSVKPGRREMQNLATALATLGFALEPDPAFGGRTPRPDEPVAIFRRDDGEAAMRSEAYQAVLLKVTLAALVAAADGTIVEQELALLVQHIDTAGLAQAERRRLAAHLHWLVACPPDFNAVKARLTTLPAEARHEVGSLILAIAAADGRIDPAEIKLLQKLYKTLGLDPDEVFADLHSLGTDQSQASRPAAAEEAASAGVQLDPERIRRIQADTAHVSSVLSAVFVDEVPPPEPPPAPSPSEPEEEEADDAFAGLDRVHAELLRELLGLESWGRGDYETLARSLGLMPDGAVEVLNDWAFDRFDEAIVEDGAPLTINRHLLPSSLPELAPHV